MLEGHDLHQIYEKGELNGIGRHKERAKYDKVRAYGAQAWTRIVELIELIGNYRCNYSRG